MTTVAPEETLVDPPEETLVVRPVRALTGLEPGADAVAVVVV